MWEELIVSSFARIVDATDGTPAQLVRQSRRARLIRAQLRWRAEAHFPPIVRLVKLRDEATRGFAK